MKQFELTTKQERNIAEDKFLVRRILKGSEPAFAELFKKYEHMVYHKFIVSVRDEVVAQDLTMEVFQKVYERLEGYDEDKGAFSTWLHVITGNHLIDHLRKERERQNISQMTDLSAEYGDEDSPGEYTIHSGIDNPSQEMMKKEVYDKLIECIDCYVKSDELRSILMMRYFEELSYEEIAEKVQKPLGTVKASLHRARGILQEKLKDKKYLFLYR